jgi:hypothetical protein
MHSIRCGSPKDIDLQRTVESPKRGDFLDGAAACQMTDNPLYLPRVDISSAPVDEDLNLELQGVANALMASVGAPRASSRPSAVPTTSDGPQRQVRSTEELSVVGTLNGPATTFLWGSPARPTALPPTDGNQSRKSYLKNNRRLLTTEGSEMSHGIRKRTVSGDSAPKADKRYITDAF